MPDDPKGSLASVPLDDLLAAASVEMDPRKLTTLIEEILGRLDKKDPHQILTLLPSSKPKPAA